VTLASPPAMVNEGESVVYHFTIGNLLDRSGQPYVPANVQITANVPGLAEEVINLAGGQASYVQDVELRFPDDSNSGTVQFKVYVDGALVKSLDVTTTVNDVAPLAKIEGLSNAVAGKTSVLHGSATDPGADRIVSWKWTVAREGQISLIGRDKDYAFLPSLAGPHVVTLTVTDEDGHVSSVSKTIEVSSVTIDVGDDDSGTETLTLRGTVGNDRIRLHQRGDKLIVTIKGAPLIYNMPRRIIVSGGAGDDQIVVRPEILVPVMLIGDTGNDMLRAGGGQSVLVGGAGNDRLIGGLRPSVLIGGSQRDAYFLSSGVGFVAHEDEDRPIRHVNRPVFTIDPATFDQEAIEKFYADGDFDGLLNAIEVGPKVRIV
jgi:hypothetical protein